MDRRRFARRLLDGGNPVKIEWNTVMTALVLVRMGQELGTVSPASKTIHDLLELLANLPLKIFG